MKKSIALFALFTGVMFFCFAGQVYDPILGKLRSDIAGTGTFGGSPAYLVGETSITADTQVPRWSGVDRSLLTWSMMYINDAGTPNIPAGQTYNINGSPHTHASMGDVVGPSSSVDNQVARFDLTTGKLIQASSMYIDDYGVGTLFGLNATETGLSAGDDKTAGTPNTAGTIKFYSAGDNNYFISFTAATMTESSTYTWPIAKPGSDMYLKSTSAGVMSWGSPGLAYFTESEVTAAPNNTVYVDNFKANGATTNVDAAFIPKGTGAFLVSVPDSTATGGNKRGARAVDLQLGRAAATEVASGTSSTIAGGYGNTSSSTYSTVGGGNANVASNTYSVVAGGYTNAASDSYSTVSGGQNNTSSAAGAAVCGGEGNTASAADAIVLGGINNTSSGAYSTTMGYYAVGTHDGEVAVSGGRIAAKGDCQRGSAQARITTSAAALTELFLDGSATRFTLVDSDHYAFTLKLLGAQDDGSTGYWEAKIVVKREGATTSISGAVTLTTFVEDTNIGTPTWTIAADDTNDALSIKVTPANATATAWTAAIEYVKLNY